MGQGQRMPAALVKARLHRSPSLTRSLLERRRVWWGRSTFVEACCTQTWDQGNRWIGSLENVHSHHHSTRVPQWAFAPPSCPCRAHSGRASHGGTLLGSTESADGPWAKDKHEKRESRVFHTQGDPNMFHRLGSFCSSPDEKRANRQKRGCASISPMIADQPPPSIKGPVIVFFVCRSRSPPFR